MRSQFSIPSGDFVLARFNLEPSSIAVAGNPSSLSRSFCLFSRSDCGGLVSKLGHPLPLGIAVRLGHGCEETLTSRHDSPRAVFLVAGIYGQIRQETELRKRGPSTVVKE